MILAQINGDTLMYKEIMNKSINRALALGWFPSEKPSPNRWEVSYVNDHVVGISNYKSKGNNITVLYTEVLNIHELIFNHEFAKTFWGEHNWKYHLQQMVLADDPVIYLGEHTPSNTDSE